MASGRHCKRAYIEFLDAHDDDTEKVYQFQILLPNGTSTRLTLRDPGDEMSMDDFIHVLRTEIEKAPRTSNRARRKILWNENIYLEDMYDNKIRKKICFSRFKSNKCHLLRLHDGAGESVNTFQNMWDLTPDTELLAELPAEYSFETALADLIDNSLQAVWSNGPDERRLLRVTIDEQKIEIFDSGSGMDGSDENSISKWGKMGSSNHRPYRKQAIGGEAPYLMPYFGMFGYGGPIASMHLGRRAVVSSKTKESKKVYTLHLSREALLSKSAPKCFWRTDGGIRNPLDKEMQISPHGSFTQVEIHDLKSNPLTAYELQCLLKDIYFPYIQCDEVLSRRKTKMPIEFQVNDINLAEIEGGEFAITNLHSCNGPEFVVQLSFKCNQDNRMSENPGLKVYQRVKANARLRFVYFPIVEGKESIDMILEKLKENSCRKQDNFMNFSRVSIRRLGRLLPDARWSMLPIMEPKLKKGERAHLLRRCCLRVKCFVEADAGFSPTPSKTDLALHDPITMALKCFGSRNSGKGPEAEIEIYKDAKLMTIEKLEKSYQDWVFDMHDKFDEEIDCGEDEPVVVVGPQNKKKLSISADVFRVHQAIRRKGFLWRSGQKVKILKGASGCQKSNLYATLEFILLEGFQGDVGGEARLICRPISCSDEKGCSLVMDNGNASLRIHDSLSFPISVIDSGKFQVLDHATWEFQLGKLKGKAPSTIDILNHEQCAQLEIDGALPFDHPVEAGYKPPSEIVAVIRPASFNHIISINSLDQKYIVKNDAQMCMEIKCNGSQEGEYILSERVKPTERLGRHGLYVFSLQRKPNLFCKAAIYSFTFSVIYKDLSCKCEAKVIVRAASNSGSWRFLRDERGPLTENSKLLARVGCCISYLSLGCFDPYGNPIQLFSLPKVKIIICQGDLVLLCAEKMKICVSHDHLSLEILDIVIKSSVLDKIRPTYEAKLLIQSLDNAFSVGIPCKVMPGPVKDVKVLYYPEIGRHLTPGVVIQDLVLEMVDGYGNHIEKGVDVSIKVDGLRFQHNIGSTLKVNELGYVNLSGNLKVTAGYGSMARLYVSVGERIIFEEIFPIQKRALKAVSGVPVICISGCMSKNVVFQVFDSNGVIDKTIDGPNHTLTVKSESLKMDGVQYKFEHGQCIVRDLPVPHYSGEFQFLAFHTHYPNIKTSIEVHVMPDPKLEIVPVANSEAEIYLSPCSDNRITLLQDTSECVPAQMDLLESMVDDARKLDEDIARVGMIIKDHECNLKRFNDEKSMFMKEIYGLEDLMEPQYLSNVDALISAKAHVVNEIFKKGNTAAAVYCNLAMAIQIEEPEQHFMKDVIGVVSLLGSVTDVKLSRILGEYLGEEYMLAIVCKSYEAAFALEKYHEDGNVNHRCALHGVATELDMRITGRFPVICLEQTRPYKGHVSKDAQRKLLLPDPKLPSEKVPGGFIGYAVNMIDIDIHQLCTRTFGYGLRETLFYQLFGEVQVYRTRADMKRANACINCGAVSLDGGIVRNNGIILLGDCEPAVQFPVLAHQWGYLPRVLGILKEIEKKKLLLEATEEKIQKEGIAYKKDLHKFKKKSERLRMVNNSLGCHLQYGTQ